MFDRVSDHSRQRIETKMEEMRDQQTREAVQEVIEFNQTPSELKERDLIADPDAWPVEIDAVALRNEFEKKAK